jgi:hypothetical protein
LCIPSVFPWTDKGKFVTSKRYTGQLFLPVKAPPYLITYNGPVFIQAALGKFFVSRDSGSSWDNLPVLPYTSASCYSSAQNSYYYLSSRSSILWVAFTIQRVEGTQHCLWAVNAINVTSSQGTQQLNVIQSWTLNSRLCSATGEGDGVFSILCGFHYISSAKLLSGSTLSPLVGSSIQETVSSGKLIWCMEWWGLSQGSPEPASAVMEPAVDLL